MYKTAMGAILQLCKGDVHTTVGTFRFSVPYRYRAAGIYDAMDPSLSIHFCFSVPVWNRKTECFNGSVVPNTAMCMRPKKSFSTTLYNRVKM